jgi:DNA polymerase-4
MTDQSSFRKIVHFDLDAFYCAVEEQLDPSLAGKAFAVGGKATGRGVIASASYKARQQGVRSAMPSRRAAQLCPDLIFVRGSHKIYGEKSREVMKVLQAFSEHIEQLSIDEAFLDVSHDPRRGREIGEAIQKKVMEETGLPCSLGIATNKLVAKVATDVGKGAKRTDTYPNSIQIIPPGKEAVFLAPLPTRALWGVGPKTAELLAEMGIHTIGQIAQWSEENLAMHFGKLGPDLAQRAIGKDSRPVKNERASKSISQEVTFWEDIHDEQTLIEQIEKQSGTIGDSLRYHGLRASTVKLKLRWPDFTTITRQASLSYPTDDGDAIFEQARGLFYANWKKGVAIRLIGVGVSSLQEPSPQLSLWDAPDLIKQTELDNVLKRLNQRFGDQSIQRGSSKET